MTDDNPKEFTTNGNSIEIDFGLDVEGVLFVDPLVTEKNAKRAQDNGFIRFDHLIMLMAKEAAPLCTLSELWDYFDCRTMPSAPPDIAALRPEDIWRWIIYRLVGFWDSSKMRRDAEPVKSLQPYNFDWATHNYIPVERKPYVELGQYIRLDEFMARMKVAERACRVRIPLPSLLFPEESESAAWPDKSVIKNANASQSDPTESGNKLPFPCAPGTKWNEIIFTVKADDLVFVQTPHGRARVSYHQLGFADRRSGDRPKGTIWPLFLLFAQLKGEISSANTKYDRNLTDGTRRLNKHLNRMFGIDDSIYKAHYKKSRCYQTKFTICDERDHGPERYSQCDQTPR